MKKILAILLAMSLIFATTVAFAAVPVENSVNPKITVTVDDVVTMDMDDGFGERTFAVVSANLALPEGTLSEKITYNSITKIATGTGIASFTFNVAFDSALFDMTTSYIVQTDSVGEWGYNANEGYMGGAMAGNANAMYVGTIEPMIQYYVALKDANTTADALNAQAFATIKLAEMQIETFEGAKTAAYSTKYSSNAADTTRNFEFATQVGAAPVLDLEKTVTGGTLDDAAKEKTYQLTVGADLKDTGVTAVLTHEDYPEDPQEVGLTFSGWAGEAKAVFNVVVKFLDYTANASKVSLSIK